MSRPRRRPPLAPPNGSRRRLLLGAAGRAFPKDLNRDGLLRPDAKALRSLDRFLPEARRIMGAS